ncbi:O-antigen ligase family protein [Phormidesmis priestleyi]
MNFSLILLTVSTLLCALVDAGTRLRGGSFSSQAVWTVLLGVTSLVFVVLRARIPKQIVGPGALLTGFLSLGVASLVFDPAALNLSLRDQAQSLLVYCGFVGVLLLGAIETYRAKDQLWYLHTGFPRACQCAALLYMVSLVAGPGSALIFGARSFALFALIAISWFLASAHYKYSKDILWAIFLIALVGLSLSRTATVIALVIFPFSRISPHNQKTWIRFFLWAGFIALLAYLAFNFVEPIRARFTDIGDSGQLGGVSLNTSGREFLWQAVQNSIARAPLFGKIIGLGPGATSLVIEGGQPHNDYLRLQHDFGYLGLGFWVLGYVWLIGITFKSWLWSDRYDPDNAHVQLAAFLSLISIGLSMITDNVIVYVFAMSPLGLLVGTAIGLHAAHYKMRNQYLQMMRSLPDVESEAEDWTVAQP